MPKPIYLIVNINADIRAFESEIRKALSETGTLPIELNDIFSVTISEEETKIKALLNWA